MLTASSFGAAAAHAVCVLGELVRNWQVLLTDATGELMTCVCYWIEGTCLLLSVVWCVGCCALPLCGRCLVQ